MFGFTMDELALLSLAPVTVLADALCWVGCVGIAMLVMRLMAGPAREDRLARDPVNKKTLLRQL